MEDRHDRTYKDLRGGGIDYLEINCMTTHIEPRFFYSQMDHESNWMRKDYLYQSGATYKNRSKRTPKIKQYKFERKIMEYYGTTIYRIYPESLQYESRTTPTIFYYLPTPNNFVTNNFMVAEFSYFHTHIYDCLEEVDIWINKFKGSIL